MKKAPWGSPEVGASAAISAPRRTPTSRRDVGAHAGAAGSRARGCQLRRTRESRCSPCEDGLTSAIGGDSCPTSSAKRDQVSSANARRIRSSGKVRPPLDGCCPPKKSTSSAPAKLHLPRTPAPAPITRHPRLPYGSARSAPCRVACRRDDKLRNVAVVDVVAGIEGVHQNQPVHRWPRCRASARPSRRSSDHSDRERQGDAEALGVSAFLLTLCGADGNRWGMRGKILTCLRSGARPRYGPLVRVAGIFSARRQSSAVRVTMLGQGQHVRRRMWDRRLSGWLPRTPAPSAPVRAEIGTADKEFSPHVLVVPLGSTVSFPNHDPFNHNVFSLSEENPFDLGLYGRGETRSVQVRPCRDRAHLLQRARHR